MKKASAAEVIPTKPGIAFGGGLSCIRMFDGINAYMLVVASIDGEIAPCKHAQAEKKVKALKLGGKKDWRLPTRAEALAMREHLQKVLEDGDNAFQREWYWTGQQYESDPSYAWAQSFSYGYQDSYHEDFQLRARAVRRFPI